MRTRFFLKLSIIFAALNISTHLLSGCTADNKILNTGSWTVNYDTRSGGVNIKKDSILIFSGIYASYKSANDGKLVTSRDYSKRKITTEKINDAFGSGILYKIRYSSKGFPDLIQSFYVYPDKDYVLTDFVLTDKSGVESNYMAPLNVDNMPSVLAGNGDCRALFIPFDNDKWIRYRSHTLDFTKLESYEVTAIFNNDDRRGLVIGSVEHDNWKSAILMGKGDMYNIGSLTCYGGAADELTRDSKPHGALRGKTIKSPKVLLGYFNDWRNGLESYADANAAITPPKTWNKAVPFGWNSWGVLQFSLTYSKAMEVSDFFRENLQNHSFVNPDSTLYIGLDSGWNRFSEDELKSFADHCKASGQTPCIYWTPFTDWKKDPERTVENMPQYKYRDLYLYANGKPQELDGAYALDPSHPAVEAMMKKTAALFRRTGFGYVKMDFMTHGAMEADKWYNPDITTGIQGYNYGLKLINLHFDSMYINLSISPIFPAQYAQSRRIACDAWNKIKDTEYTLNATSYGWWQDRIYQFNDADHVVLRGATEGENRARITSAIITGIFITGDDFSAGGSPEGKERAKKYLVNPEVNAIATGEAFRPLEGSGEKSENQFLRADKNGCYLAVFNYSENEQSSVISLERMGLDANKSFFAKELWSGTETAVQGAITVVVPAKDVMLFRIK
ncbi:MAG: alpha-galactosidase [Dysgonamonadaceae bacterium]|jgi:alpha-galactosidase|nr:alpha-galactosidase [Dysgonamonadaceae bacterium]